MEHTFNNFHSPELIFFLKSLEANALPGLQAHLELTPYRAVAGNLPQVPDSARKSGVAVILGLHEQKPVIVLIKRVNYKGVHGGQISFPGGKQEAGDTGLLQTAQRETSEEIGLSLAPAEYVRPLTAIYIPPSNFLVQPYLFVTERKLELRPNHEVDYPILADAGMLLSQQSLQKTEIRLSDGMVMHDAPCFVYGTEIIWGATAAILNELKWMINAYLKTLQER